MFFVKPPGFQGQAWHQDEIYIPTRDRSLTGAWIALDDATIENGCLWVIPGSHRTGYLYPQRRHDNPDEFDFAMESHGFDGSQEIPVEVPTGALVFLGTSVASGTATAVAVENSQGGFGMLPITVVVKACGSISASC